MRVIEEKMVHAVRHGKSFRCGNTTVLSQGDLSFVRLHGNLIAIYNRLSGELVVSDAGWQTVTTKSRLNALLRAIKPGNHIWQSKWIWFHNDLPFSGKATIA